MARVLCRFIECFVQIKSDYKIYGNYSVIRMIERDRAQGKTEHLGRGKGRMENGWK
jgi:hypothetical protein